MYIQQWSLNKKLSIQTHPSTTWDIFWDLHQENIWTRLNHVFFIPYILLSFFAWNSMCLVFHEVPWSENGRNLFLPLFLLAYLWQKRTPHGWILRQGPEYKICYMRYFLQVIQHLLKEYSTSIFFVVTGGNGLKNSQWMLCFAYRQSCQLWIVSLVIFLLWNCKGWLRQIHFKMLT